MGRECSISEHPDTRGLDKLLRVTRNASTEIESINVYGWEVPTDLYLRIVHSPAENAHLPPEAKVG